MGDAVHAEPIIGGEGANAAIRDGVSLAECMTRNIQVGKPAFGTAKRRSLRFTATPNHHSDSWNSTHGFLLQMHFLA
jgi:2-polyprenyl-6-methoxyphenol hydroxylase-like FAD-dependent oxidoreductase